MVKALLVIAFRNFQDWEFLKTKEVLEKNKIDCDAVSTQKGLAKGTFGAEFKVSKILEEINSKDYDCIIFVGGSGTPSIRASKYSIKLAETFFKEKKVIGAVCWAPTILAKSGILKNKKATVWLGFDEEYNQNTDKVLEQYGADFVSKDLVVDGNIITAEGPSTAEKFAEAIIKVLKK